ncbi:MAG: hypothetical protein Q8L80_01400 [Gallionella sp.]|nr:hypothetical protein [Gallionella sp.]MDP1942101.1 hypothetical protein [Gallionella sp.]
MVAIIAYLGMLVGFVGIFFGFYYLADNPSVSMKIVTLSTVGIVGILGFIRHVIFHKSDAKRLGWETERPDWMFEVGFANLAFGIIGILSVIGNQSSNTQAVVVLGYAIYLLQAGVLHGFRYFTDPIKSSAKFWRNCVATLLYAGIMTFFAIQSL